MNEKIVDGKHCNGLNMLSIKLFYILAISVLAVNLAFASNSPKQKIDSLIESGINASRSGDIKGGIKYFEQVLSIDPNNIDALNNLGVSYFVTHDYNRSLYYQSKAVELKPSDPRIYFNRGLLLEKYMGRYKESIPDFTKAIELEPKYARAYLNRLFAYMGTKQYKNALKDIMLLEKIDPTIEKLIIEYKTEAHYRIGDIGNAKKDLERAKKLDAPIDKWLIDAIKKADHAKQKRENK